jgi:hypothetical protein
MYVFLHRRYVLWMRGNKQLTSFLQKNRFIYPFFISFIISALTFPPGPGMFQVRRLVHGLLGWFLVPGLVSVHIIGSLAFTDYQNPPLLLHTYICS